MEASPSRRRQIALVLALVALGGLYLALRPFLTGMLSNARKMDQETEQALAQAQHTARIQSEVEKARAAVAARPNDPNAYLTLAEMQMQSGSFEEAAASAKAAQRLVPGGIIPTLVLADVYQRSRRYDEAIQIYREALKQSPNYPRAVAGLSVIYLALGWTRDARILLEAGTAANPSDRHLKTALALACIQHSEFDRAEKLLVALRDQDPNDTSLWGPLTDLYLKAERPKDALRVLREAERQFPDDVRVSEGLARALAATGDFSGVEREARKGLAQSPDSIPLRYWLAIALQRGGKEAQAVAEFEAVLKASPDYEKTRLLLGQLYRKMGRTAEGSRLLAEHQKAYENSERFNRANLRVSMKPDDPEAHFALARLYEERKNSDRMTVELRKTLELNPSHTEARTLWERTAGGLSE